MIQTILRSSTYRSYTFQQFLNQLIIFIKSDFNILPLFYIKYNQIIIPMDNQAESNNSDIFQLGQQSCVSLHSQLIQKPTQYDHNYYQQLEKPAFTGLSTSLDSNPQCSQAAYVFKKKEELLQFNRIQKSQSTKVVIGAKAYKSKQKQNQTLKQPNKNIKQSGQLQTLEKRLQILEFNHKAMIEKFENTITLLSQQLIRRENRNKQMQKSIFELSNDVKSSKKDVQILMNVLNSQTIQQQTYQIHPERKLKSISPENLSNQKEKKNVIINTKKKSQVENNVKMPRINMSPKEKQATTRKIIGNNY